MSEFETNKEKYLLSYNKLRSMLDQIIEAKQKLTPCQLEQIHIEFIELYCLSDACVCETNDRIYYIKVCSLESDFDMVIEDLSTGQNFT